MKRIKIYNEIKYVWPYSKIIIKGSSVKDGLDYNSVIGFSPDLHDMVALAFSP